MAAVDFTFKSSGTTIARRRSETVASSGSLAPIGIKTPVELGSDGGILVMHTDTKKQVADNLRNLVQTSWGERLGLYAFGGNLRPLLSDWSSLDDFEARAMQRISEAVQRWMPFVNLNEFSVQLRDASTNFPLVEMSITYNVPALGAIDQRIVVSMRVM